MTKSEDGRDGINGDRLPAGPDPAGLPVAAALRLHRGDESTPAIAGRAPWRNRLRRLYVGSDDTATRFQRSVAVVDILIIAFFIASPVIQDWHGFLWVDYAIAVLLALDLAARAAAASVLSKWIRRPVVWVDFIVLATLLAPTWMVNLGFLRILRLWTLSQKDFFWRFLSRLGREDWEDAARAIVNLVTCLFVITGFVYIAFAGAGSGIQNWIDALYFTVAAVTTTGFGDVTLPGTLGKLTSIVTMIVGISLFVRLAQALFRPFKVTFRCPRCALMRHDPDAVHCKACGHLLAIPDEGGD